MRNTLHFHIVILVQVFCFIIAVNGQPTYSIRNSTANPLCNGIPLPAMNTMINYSFSGNAPLFDDNYCSSYFAPGEEFPIIFTPPSTGYYIFTLFSESQLALSYKVDDTSCSNLNLINCYLINANNNYDLNIGPLTGGVPYKFLFDLTTLNPNCFPSPFCQFSLKVSCANVASFNINNIKPNQFNLSWNCNNCGTTKYVEYGPPGFTPGTGATAGLNGTVISNASTPLTITGLAPYTRYDVYMRSGCGTSFSPNISQLNVRTAPDCATAPVVVSDSLYYAGSTGVGNNGTGAWASTACAGILRNGHEILSRFTPSQTGNYKLTIFSTSTSLSTTPVSIYTKQANLACDENNWNCAGSATLNINANPVNISIGSLTAGTTYLIMIDSDPNISNAYQVGFRISNMNNCVAPLILRIPPISLDNLTLRGTCVSCVGNTYIEYGLSGFTPGSGTNPGPGGTLITNPVFPNLISALTPGATYDVYARENCGGITGFSQNAKLTITLPCFISPASMNSSSNSVCPGAPVTLTINGANPGSTGSLKVYAGTCGGTLVGSGASIVVNPTQTTTYYARVESSCGNSNCVSVTVNVTPAATITPADSTTFCAGGSVTLNANTGAGLTYQWKKYGNPIAGATASSYVATGSGSYRVVVTNVSGCSASASPVIVTVNPLPTATISSTGSTAICPGSSVTLNANTGAGLNYQWKKYSNDISGATGANYAATGAGTYKVRVTDLNGCSKNSNSIVVTSLTAPTASITATGATTFCAGDSVKLSATSGAGNTYQWRKGSSVLNGATGLNYYAKTPGNYKVTVTAANGCTKNSNVIAVNVPCRIGEFEESAFDIYPNPSMGIIKVVIHENESATLEIKDLTGKIIHMNRLNKIETEIDLTALTAGIYMAELKTSQMRVVRKIVIQK